MRQLSMRSFALSLGALGVAGVLSVAPRAVRAQGPASAAAPAAHAAALNDPTIVAIFDAANTWDMETGALGARKGSSKAVRDFGSQLVRDHRAVRQQGRDLATKLGVTPTPPRDFAMAKDHATAMRELEAAHGKAFDRAFLANEVRFHKAVIDAVNETLLPSLHNEQVKELVKQVAPAFQAHMQMAQHLLDQLGN